MAEDDRAFKTFRMPLLVEDTLDSIEKSAAEIIDLGGDSRLLESARAERMDARRHDAIMLTMRGYYNAHGVQDADELTPEQALELLNLLALYARTEME
jgi:hypothetical protein